MGFISYKVANSYALFFDSITGEKTIEFTVYDNLDRSGANEPVLSDNMIPVYYDETAEVWKKADKANGSRDYKWYDYSNKMWANSVTVSSTNRSKYLSASLGTIIPMDDVLTMQVWIPRYKYKVWNYNLDGSVGSGPQKIEIVFENGTLKTGDITCTDTTTKTAGGVSEICKVGSTNCTDALCNGKTYTHPAFTFGDEELTGFWAAKFETTGSSSTMTVKPNLVPLTNVAVGTFYNNFLAMNDSGNIYGFSANDDTHMMRNIEWGAVTYLSHSKYGTCTGETCVEVGINNKGNYNSTSGTATGLMTGCGSAAGSSQSDVCNPYNGAGVIASTTGNIYGVYDMSGGCFDWVSASMIKSDGNFCAPTGISYGPARKYHDYYSYGTTDKDSTARKREKLGDAGKEVYNNGVSNWYDDVNYNVYVSGWWLGRGASMDSKNLSGIFCYHRLAVTGASFFSSRLAISPLA